MRVIVEHQKLGTIEYSESYFGKRELKVNGDLAKKVKKSFVIQTESGVKHLNYYGNVFMGMYLDYEGEKIWLFNKPEWYVILITSLIAVFFLVWGNVPALVKIIPIIGGAVGGGITGGICVNNIILTKFFKSPILKIVICMGTFFTIMFFCTLFAIPFIF